MRHVESWEVEEWGWNCKRTSSQHLKLMFQCVPQIFSGIFFLAVPINNVGMSQKLLNYILINIISQFDLVLKAAS